MPQNQLCLTRQTRFVFTGAGWKLFYYLGVSHYLQSHLPPVYLKNIRFAGASAGSWIALLLASSTPATKAKDYWVQRAHVQRKRKGLFHRVETEESMKGMLQLMDVNQSNFDMISKRLTVYISCLGGGLHASSFQDEEDLFCALMASAFVPWLTGRSFFYAYRGKYCFDGGVRKIPFYEQDIIVSLSEKRHDLLICPKLIFKGSSFYPPSKNQADKMFDSGYFDAQSRLKDRVIKSG